MIRQRLEVRRAIYCRQSRQRKRASRFSKSSAQRWAQVRERYLLQHGPPTANREVATLEAFARRFVEAMHERTVISRAALPASNPS